MASMNDLPPGDAESGSGCLLVIIAMVCVWVIWADRPISFWLIGAVFTSVVLVRWSEALESNEQKETEPSISRSIYVACIKQFMWTSIWATPTKNPAIVAGFFMFGIRCIRRF